ncbi:MAG: hypothetical protein D6690_04000 [Nitrospirae bacterium]|nr:MAG: hypothetical protein D6690_04000 [Nitrospirota bacterium]
MVGTRGEGQSGDRGSDLVSDQPCTANRYIDFPPQGDDTSRFGIGIENKPWAGEQHKQLADYRIELERRYKGQFILVFLTRRGRKPARISSEKWKNLEQAGRAVILDYSVDVHAWLVTCQQQSRADNIRHFLGDFARYVQVSLGSIDGEENPNDDR